MNNAILEHNTIDTSVLQGLFGTGSMDVLTAETSAPVQKQSNVLKNNALAVEKTLEDAVTEAAKPEEVTPPAKVEVTKEIVDILDSAVSETIAQTEAEPEITLGDKGEKGRPKTDKNALVSYLSAKVEANEFGIPEDAPFDAKKQTLQQYLESLPEKDLHSLLDSNLKAQIDEVRAATPKEFYESLPEELQYAAAYVAEGGTDLKGLFSALSRVEEVKVLDPEKESDQALIAKSYLMATRFGNDEQIAEQIEDWKDANKLEKKAKEFKPALDNMQKQQVEAHLKQAEEQRIQQQELAQFYSQNVYKTLENNELAGIKLDKKFAKELAANMVTTVSGPWNGAPVNYLGYGLQKSQYVEPDYEAVMLAAWILNDKKSALEALGQQKANKAVEQAAKLIKMNQGLGTSEVPVPEQKQVKRINTSNVLKRTA